MADESVVVKTYRNGKITHKDASGKQYEVRAEDGDFALAMEQAARTVVRDRGVITGLRKGDDPVLTASYTVDMTQFANGSGDTIVDCCEQTGGWAGATSTGGPNYEFFMQDVDFVADGVAYGDGADHTLTMKTVFCTWDFKEGERNKITVKLEIYGGVTRSGPA